MKKYLAGLALAGAMLFGWGGVARANPSTASATCQGGIVYEGHDYPTQSPPKNTVTAYWDNVIVSGFPKSFSGQTSGTVPNPDKTKAHTWKVVWDRYQGTDGDRTQSGSIAACQTPPTTTLPTTTTAPSTVPSTTTTVPVVTTTAPASTTTTDPTTTTVPEEVPICLQVPIPEGAVCGPATVITPPPPAPTTPPVVSPALPATGSNLYMLLIAGLFISLGVGALLAVRRSSVGGGDSGPYDSQ